MILMLSILETSLAHNTKETRMDLKVALMKLLVENQCTMKKSFEHEKECFSD